MVTEVGAATTVTVPPRPAAAWIVIAMLPAALPEETLTTATVFVFMVEVMVICAMPLMVMALPLERLAFT